jgi:outer membrane protein OmpA-like peptidoglycan-associated protein
MLTAIFTTAAIVAFIVLVAAILPKNNGTTVTLSGHTDNL